MTFDTTQNASPQGTDYIAAVNWLYSSSPVSTAQTLIVYNRIDLLPTVLSTVALMRQACVCLSSVKTVSRITYTVLVGT